MSWNYQRDESTGFKPIPVGDYRIRIAKAEKAVSKTGKDMPLYSCRIARRSLTAILHSFLIALRISRKAILIPLIGWARSALAG